MSLLNSKDGYGAVNKLLHWTIVALILNQYIAANIMLRIERNETVLGWTQGNYYDWHKSIGLIVLAVAVIRLTARQVTPLPDWAPSLSERERRVVPVLEKLLYAAMLLMPVTGYLYVMAGDYGVQFFGLIPLPNPIGKVEWLAAAAKYAHIGLSYLLLIALGGHIGLVLRHQLVLKDGLIRRMLPGRGPS